MYYEKVKRFDTVLSLCVPTLQGAGALLGEAQMLLAQSLERLMLSNLHTCAHVAVAMYEEGECAGQVLTAW